MFLSITVKKVILDIEKAEDFNVNFTFIIFPIFFFNR